MTNFHPNFIWAFDSLGTIQFFAIHKVREEKTVWANLLLKINKYICEVSKINAIIV